MRPHQDYRVVYYQPYRAYYEPSRISYTQYSNYYLGNNNYINKNNFYRPGQKVEAYNQGRRTTTERNLKSSLRSSQNTTRTASSSPEVEKTPIRSNTSVTRRTQNSSVSNGRSSQKEISNLENHRAAVLAQRGRTTTAREKNVPAEIQPLNRRSTTAPARAENPVQARSPQRSNSSSTANQARVEQPRQKAVSRATTPERSTSVRRTQNNTKSSSVRAQSNTSRSSSARTRSASTTSEARRSRDRS